MTVRQLMAELEKMDQTANVYFRKGRTLNAVTILRVNSHTGSIIELTNEENARTR